jgi:plastocyanin
MMRSDNIFARRTGPVLVCGLGLAVSSTFFGCDRPANSPNAPAKVSTTTSPATTAPAGTVVSVSMRGVQFSPATVEVERGGTVEWKNDDMVPHTVTAPSFDSGSIASDQSWRHTFADAGTFPYVCRFHTHMTGTVVVK